MAASGSGQMPPVVNGIKGRINRGGMDGYAPARAKNGRAREPRRIQARVTYRRTRAAVRQPGRLNGAVLPCSGDLEVVSGAELRRQIRERRLGGTTNSRVNLVKLHHDTVVDWVRRGARKTLVTLPIKTTPFHCCCIHIHLYNYYTIQYQHDFHNILPFPIVI